MEFAEFAASAKPDPMVRAKTALILADTVGAIVGGAAEPDVADLRRRLSDRSHGACTVIGTRERADAATAALLNGIAGTTLEMDEGNQFARGHPAIHVIPAVLADAAGHDPGGAALIDAIALGYEAAARVGIATRLRGTMHPHGTWGAVGAAVAVLRLRGADPGAFVEAMNMAASLGSTTSRRTMLEGGTVRNVFAGVSNQMGLLAADLAQTGFSGDSDGLGHVFGKVAGESFDRGAMTRALGEDWEVMRNYFKMHACCRFNHAALDALNAILRDRPVAVEEIASVSVESYAFAAELDDPAPRNVLAAKFSIPFAMATAIVTGSTGVESFTARRVSDPVIAGLAARVRVAEDPAMSAMLPERRPARVTLHLTGGAKLTSETETNRGDWADPYGPDEIRNKYMSLATRLWTPDHAGAMWDAVLNLPNAGSAQCVMDGLAG